MFIDNLQLSAVQLLQDNEIVERGTGCKLLRLRKAGAFFIRGHGVQDRETSQRGAGCFRGAAVLLAAAGRRQTWTGGTQPRVYPGFSKPRVFLAGYFCIPSTLMRILRVNQGYPE